MSGDTYTLHASEKQIDHLRAVYDRLGDTTDPALLACESTIKQLLDGTPRQIAASPTPRTSWYKKTFGLRLDIVVPRTIFECIKRYIVPSFKANAAVNSTSRARLLDAANGGPSYTPGPGDKSTDLAKAVQPTFDSFSTAEEPFKVKFRYHKDLLRILDQNVNDHIKQTDVNSVESSEKAVVDDYLGLYGTSHRVVPEAELYYELDQSGGMMPFIAHLLNRILKSPCSYILDRMPFVKSHWVTPAKSNEFGVTDWICYHGALARASLEWKRLRALLCAHMGSIRTASENDPQGLRMPNGFELSLQGGKIVMDVHGASLEPAAKRVCLQAWTSCQRHKTRWIIIFNTVSTIVMYQAKHDEMWVSDLISDRPTSGQVGNRITLLTAMTGAALGVILLDGSDSHDRTFRELAANVKQSSGSTNEVPPASGEVITSEPVTGDGDNDLGSMRDETMEMDDHTYDAPSDAVEHGDEPPYGPQPPMFPLSPQFHAIRHSETKQTESVNHGPITIFIGRPANLGRGHTWTTFEARLNGDTAHVSTALEISVEWDPLIWSCAQPTRQHQQRPVTPVFTAKHDPGDSPSNTDKSEDSTDRHTTSTQTQESQGYSTAPSSATSSQFPSNLPVLVKLAVVNDDHPMQNAQEIRDLSGHEIKLYQTRLAPLQGLVVPQTFGAFTGLSNSVEVNMLIQERLYKPVSRDWDSFPPTLATAVLCLYDQLRAAGIVHGDIQARHILWRTREKSELRLIDFDRSVDVDHPQFQHLIDEDDSDLRRALRSVSTR